MDVRDGAIRVRAAAVRLPGPVLSGLRTMAAGAALAWFATAGSLHQFIGWIGALLFGAATLLRLDRDGVPDLRLRIISPASASAMSRRCRPSAPALRRYGMVMLIAPVGLAALCAAPLGAEEFRSPSGNITCMFSSPSNPETALPGRENMREYREYDVRCDMFDYTPSWSTPPDDCDLDWGGSLGVSETGPGIRNCYGDTILNPDAPVLDYGRAISVPGLTCRSERAGVTCTNRQGRGFFISRLRQRIF